MPKKTVAVSSGNFQLYTDPTGEFGNQELKYGLWYVQHKVLMYRILLGLLIGVNIGLWVFSLASWAIYLLNYDSQKAFEQSLGHVQNFSAINQNLAAKPLQVLSTSILPGGSENYDAVGEITNVDPRFLSSFDYYFILNGTSTPKRRAFLLPGESSLLAELGLPPEVGTSNATLQLENFAWHRISPHQIKNITAWQSERLNFEVSNFLFEDAYNQNGLKVNRITFDLLNNSAFGYKNPNFLVGLFSGDTLEGVMPLEEESFASMENKKVDLRNFVSNLQIDNVRIFPLINLYDSSVYLSPSEK